MKSNRISTHALARRVLLRKAKKAKNWLISRKK